MVHTGRTHRASHRCKTRQLDQLTGFAADHQSHEVAFGEGTGVVELQNHRIGAGVAINVGNAAIAKSAEQGAAQGGVVDSQALGTFAVDQQLGLKGPIFNIKVHIAKNIGVIAQSFHDQRAVLRQCVGADTLQGVLVASLCGSTSQTQVLYRVEKHPCSSHAAGGFAQILHNGFHIGPLAARLEHNEHGAAIGAEHPRDQLINCWVFPNASRELVKDALHGHR